MDYRRRGRNRFKSCKPVQELTEHAKTLFREFGDSVVTSLVLVGVGEFAQIAFEYFSYDSAFTVEAFAVDKEFIPKSAELFGIPVVDIAEIAEKFPPKSHQIFVAIPATNLNHDRSRMVERVKKLGYTCASYVSSRAFVWRNATIGENCFIFEHNVIQPWVEIGDSVILWSGNHIGHRSVVEDHVFISSHVVISGYCRVGHHSFIGVNATVNDGVKIGAENLIGAAAHLTKDTLPGGLYIGSPAKSVSGRSSRDVKL